MSTKEEYELKMANHRLQYETTVEAGGVVMLSFMLVVVLISQLSEGFPDLNVLKGERWKGVKSKVGSGLALGTICQNSDMPLASQPFPDLMCKTRQHMYLVFHSTW